MTSSMLAAIRDAVVDATELDPSLAHGDGSHSPIQEVTMSENNGKPAAAGISQADHDAAVAKAHSEGVTKGSGDERTRLGAILSADGIKGDGKRMSAALDLAVKSPGMSADDVTGFVAGNVAATSTSKAEGSTAQTYEARRLAAAGGLAMPEGGKSEKSGLTALVDRHINRG